MPSLPLAIHSVAQVRAIDHHAITKLGIPGYTLMTRAAAAGLLELRRSWPAAGRILVLCGTGNNAGDGYVLARLAAAQQLDVTVMALGDPRALQGDAATAWGEYVSAGGKIIEWEPQRLQDADVLVDALFGTGLSRPLDGAWCARIEAVNAARKPVLSLDVPSGLDADTGAIRGAAIKAERTVVFVGLKIGLHVGAGPDHAGELHFDALGIPPAVGEQVGYVASRLHAGLLDEFLPPRRRTAHKGHYGRVLVVAGNAGMGGAARLAGEACLRVGAGRVTVATRAANVAGLVAGRPELMTRSVEDVADLVPLLEQADVIAVGPGLGTDAWAQAVFSAVLSAGMPLVVDADALNLLAASPRRREDWILTPHPGEAASLLGSTSAAVQSDRMGSVAALVERFGGVVVLKGAGTLVATTETLPALCVNGNPGMAVPGMGDVLTGVIAGLFAQSRDLWSAARVGVLVHAWAGDSAARAGERGLLASDLFAELRQCVNR